jgi:2-polyprenyl-3-methyl-5-hydroxy-6-metoxy-1,4-benzoquinol methylase
MASASESAKNALSGPAIHEIWESVYRNPRSERLYELIFDWIARRGGVPAESSWLDIGCGIGQHAIRLRNRGFRVVAADFSPDRVSVASEHVRQQGLAGGVTVQHEDLVSGLSFSAGSFDAILCWGVLMHIPQMETAMLETIRVVKPGGSLFIYEVNLHGLDAMASYLISLGKRAVGKSPYNQVMMGPYGREYVAQTAAGELLIRHSRISSIVSFFAQHRCYLKNRIAGEFTERYSVGGPLGQLAHTWNEVWFRRGHSPYFAHGNLLVFEKAAQPSSSPAPDER